MTQNPYNEDNYLNGNPIYIRFFEESYRNNNAKALEEQDIFKCVLEEYDEFIEKVALFIKQLGYKSILECSMIISFLVNNGYLSSDMEFEMKAPNSKKEISSSLGTSIVRGEGCCRNYTQIHQDIFAKLGEYMEKLYCYQGSNVFNRAKNSRANHVISLVRHENNTYGIDLYNNDRLYHFINSLVLKEISMYDSSLLRYKPYYDISMDGMSLEEVLKRLETFEDYSKNRFINPFDYQDGIKFEIQRRLRRSEDDMKAFHEETKVLKKTIAEDINYIFSD